jgi:uncharacterized protein (DUF2141 family)
VLHRASPDTYLYLLHLRRWNDEVAKGFRPRLGSTSFYVQFPERWREQLKSAKGTRWIVVLLATASFGAGAAAEDVTVRVENLRNGEGSVLVAICTPDVFLSRQCRHHARTKARPGSAEVTVADVPPGSYAVQAIHDENDNLELDRNVVGLPREGVGFSRDAPMRHGPPRFSDAAVKIGGNSGSVTLSMRYY